MKKFSNYLIIFLWIYTVVLLPPFLLIYILNIFVPNSSLISDLAQKTPSFQTIIFLVLVFPSIGAIVGIKNNIIKPIAIWTLPRNQIISIFALSLMLSYFFWRFLSYLSFLNYYGFIILFIFFIVFFPQLNLFLNTVNIDIFKDLLHINYKNKKEFLNTLVLISLSILTVLFINLIVIYINKQVNIFTRWRSFTSSRPKIDKVEPKIVYYANKVVLTGNNFGWKGNISTEFYNQYGKIDIDLWTDSKVIFTVPLHWKIGIITLWVEKLIKWEGKDITAKSNMTNIKLISNIGPWDQEDDEYFNQLKNLNEETLKVNGY